MYFSEITKPNGSFKKPPNEGTYDLHQFVWSLFNTGVRNFLYSLYNGKVYVVSENKPKKLSNEEVTIKTQDYDPKFSEGQMLRFDIRLNAETHRENGKPGKYKRLSIVTAQKIDEGDDYDGNRNRLMHEAASRWLNYNGAKLGFKVRDFRVMNSHYYDFRNSKSNLVKFLSLDLQGVLEVTGPEVFKYSLQRGIGRTRCHGCGLMLVAP